jgi:isopentenyl phosphate kinase
VVKLGGSLITNKDKPLAINRAALVKVARSIAKSRLPSKSKKLILIHGGGSFGHYYAKQYGISTSRKRVNPMGISKTTWAMLHLHSQVRRVFFQEGVNVETILPSEIVTESSNAVSESGRSRLNGCFSNGLIPITFGFVQLSKTGASILSGDKICEALARSLRVERVIFAMAVDGVYRDASMDGGIITDLRKRIRFTSKERRYDVTGGINSKVSLGFRLASLGTQVFFVNGRKNDRLLRLIEGEKDVLATRIYPGKANS